MLWGLPYFSEAERGLFLTLNQREGQTLGRLRTPRTKLHFLLQLGYFRARQQTALRPGIGTFAARSRPGFMASSTQTRTVIIR
ncbi:MAG: DUF4158 domain-containing protein [Woeseiaceae bacterium]|nr:DUF4158 domain-containing protein [Woeseiaceae bacterium]